MQLLQICILYNSR